MSPEVWWPASPALLLGALVGFWISRRLSPGDASLAERRQKIADLEAERDRILERLQGADEGLGPERTALEMRAAGVMRDLDRLVPGSGRSVQPTRSGRGGEMSMDDARTESGFEGSREEGSSPATGRLQLARAFSAGLGTAVVLGLLVFWALREGDSSPEATASPRAPGSPPMASMPAHSTSQALAPEAATQVALLRARLEEGPGDLAARKELALLLLNSQQLVAAFEEAEQILAARPSDLDGLYVQGVVRFAMGQSGRATELLDRVLDRYPGHVLAWLARGKAYLRQGDFPMAMASWERGLEAAGGRHPELEGLLAAAQAGDSVEEILHLVGLVPAPSALPEASRPALAANTFTVRVELAADARPDPSAVLFISLRGPGEGPPVAAKRVRAPVFPLRLSLGPEDSMLGQPLPGRGRLSVRLDRDGSATTREEGELAAEVELAAGESARLVLGT